MTIVAAAFKPDAADCAAAYVPKELAKDSVGLPQSEWKTSRTDESIENQLRRGNICVAGNAKAATIKIEFQAAPATAAGIPNEAATTPRARTRAPTKLWGSRSAGRWRNCRSAKSPNQCYGHRVANSRTYSRKPFPTMCRDTGARNST